jgi:hypothetical protein
MPTIKIDHERGKLVDSNSGEEYDELYWIMLGLVKQRVLWPPEVSEGKEYPLCRSYDFHTGHPDEDKFPWKASNFNPQSYSDPVRLPCDECPLQVWGSHPNREAPWCSEQHTYPVLVPFGDDGKNLAPAIFMAQRSPSTCGGEGPTTSPFPSSRGWTPPTRTSGRTSVSSTTPSGTSSRPRGAGTTTATRWTPPRPPTLPLPILLHLRRPRPLPQRPVRTRTFPSRSLFGTAPPTGRARGSSWCGAVPCP